MFLDHEGEAVVVSDSQIPSSDLQVIGAYSGIFLSTARRVCSEMEFGETDRLKVACGGSHLLITAMKEGYYLVLVLSHESHEGLAWRHLLAARDRLNEEI